MRTYNVRGVLLYDGKGVNLVRDDKNMTEAELCRVLSVTLEVREEFNRSIESLRKLLGYVNGVPSLDKELDSDWPPAEFSEQGTNKGLFGDILGSDGERWTRVIEELLDGDL